MPITTGSQETQGQEGQHNILGQQQRPQSEQVYGQGQQSEHVTGTQSGLGQSSTTGTTSGTGTTYGTQGYEQQQQDKPSLGEQIKEKMGMGSGQTGESGSTAEEHRGSQNVHQVDPQSHTTTTGSAYQK